MNTMKILTVISIITFGAGLTQTVSAGVEDEIDNYYLSSAGKFEVGNGEIQTIVHNKTDSLYRICVDNARYNVPLKLMYDGNTSTVTPGNCTDITAKEIRVEPSTRLGEDLVMVGKFEHIK